MRRIFPIIAGMAWMSIAAFAGPPRDLSLEGTINGERRIRMTLHVEGGRVSGAYTEQNSGRKAVLRGSVHDDGTLAMDELDAGGRVVAAFDGKWREPGLIDGKWRKRGDPIARPFALDLARPQPAWPGHWGAEDNQVNWESFLDISEPSPRKLEFILSSNAGAHGCEISGTIKAQGKRAAWKDAESGCELVFTLAADAIEVTVKGDCHSFCGARAALGDGRFRRGQSSLTQTLSERYMLDDEMDKALADLAGDDYELFAGSFQEGEGGAGEDLDGLGAEVLTGGVRGLYTIQEAIVMTAPGPKVWAAVIDPGREVVKYFTNDPAFSKKLPRTIEEWRKNFSAKPVVFSGRTGGGS